MHNIFDIEKLITCQFDFDRVLVIISVKMSFGALRSVVGHVIRVGGRQNLIGKSASFSSAYTGVNLLTRSLWSVSNSFQSHYSKVGSTSNTFNKTSINRVHTSGWYQVCNSCLIVSEP